MNMRPKETCHFGAQGEHEPVLCRLQADERSYIHEHLGTFQLIVDLAQPNLIVEIGTGRGDSTLAFAEGLAMTGRGHIITMDIDECREAKRVIKEAYVNDFVTFLTIDSLKVNIESDIDILFVDGLHNYNQVKAEIKKYSPFIGTGGMIIFHDSYNPAHKGVMKAIQEFVKNKYDKWNMIDYYHCNGLTILRRKDDLYSR